MIYTLEGMDTIQKGPVLDLPDIFLLAKTTWIINADYDEALEKGDVFLRHILSQAPVTRRYKYMKVSSLVQFLNPHTSSIQHAYWHLDPGVEKVWDEDSRIHILSSGPDLTSTTTFLKNSYTLDIPQAIHEARPAVLRNYLTGLVNHEKLETVQIEPNRFHTFTHLHPHVALPAKKGELRYFVRVCESNVEPHQPWEEAVRTQTSVGRPDGTGTYVNLKKDDSGLQILY